VTAVNIHTSCQSKIEFVSIDRAVCALVLAALASSTEHSPNIADISCLFTPSFLSYLSFYLNHTRILSSLLIFVLLIMTTEQCKCRGAAVICVCSCLSVECVEQGCYFLPVFFPYLPHQNASPVSSFPSLLYINLLAGGFGDQPCNNATVPPPMRN